MTNRPSAQPTKPDANAAAPSEAFPKSKRLLKPAEFRQVYDLGQRLPLRCFVAFCWKSPEAVGPKIGFTAPRALGKATRRNRMKRRVREVIRRQLWRLGAEWRLVINLRRAAYDAPQETLLNEVEKVLQRCAS